jgi:hypothetical protein
MQGAVASAGRTRSRLSLLCLVGWTIVCPKPTHSQTHFSPAFLPHTAPSHVTTSSPHSPLPCQTYFISNHAPNNPSHANTGPLTYWRALAGAQSSLEAAPLNIDSESRHPYSSVHHIVDTQGLIGPQSSDQGATFTLFSTVLGNSSPKCIHICVNYITQVKRNFMEVDVPVSSLEEGIFSKFELWIFSLEYLTPTDICSFSMVRVTPLSEASTSDLRSL